MPKPKFFLLNNNSFEGKYKIAMEMERHRDRLQQIKHGHGAIDNSLPKSVYNKNKNYSKQVNKYKLTERQKNNLLLFHRLTAIKRNPSFVREHYIENKTKQLYKFKKKLLKRENRRKKKKK
jgi:hypothetical protein